MTDKELRQIIREELLGKGPALEFRELVAVEGGDSFLPREDWEQPDIYVQAEELEKLSRGEPLSLLNNAGVAEAGWDQEVSAPLSKRSPHDGTVIEKVGGATWTYTYAGGNLTGMKLNDPENGVMQFDGEGNEIVVA